MFISWVLFILCQIAGDSQDSVSFSFCISGPSLAASCKRARIFRNYLGELGKEVRVGGCGFLKWFYGTHCGQIVISIKINVHT